MCFVVFYCTHLNSYQISSVDKKKSCKQKAPIHSSGILQVSHPNLEQTICGWHKFQSRATTKRMSYPRCGWRRLSELFRVVSLVAGSGGMWSWISRSCHCVLRERGGRAIVWTGSKRCENGGAGIFTARPWTRGLHEPFWCHPFDSILSWRVWRRLSLAGLQLHLTQVYKDNGCQTSRPATSSRTGSSKYPTSAFTNWRGGYPAKMVTWR